MILKTRKPVIIDSILPDVVSPENVFLVIVLSTAIEELNKRLNKKGFTARKIMENIDAELCKICAQDAREAYGLESILEIDTTYAIPKDTVAHICEEITKKVDELT